MNDGGKRLSPWAYVLGGVLLAVVLHFVAFLPCGVGHGDCRLLGVFFPLILLADKMGAGASVPLLLGLAEFPLAGYAFWLARRAGRPLLFAAVMLGIHAAAAAVIYTY